MSRTIAPALLAAARSLAGQPAVTLDIADRRLHWRGLISGIGAGELCSQVVDDTTLHRVRTLGTSVQVARVTNPATASQWTTWTTLASSVAADSDCAIARYAPNALRAYYLSTAGGVENIREKESTDSGASWSTFTAVATPAAGTHMFAAAHQRVFYATGAGIATRSKASGSWSAESAWGAYAGHTALYGLGACYNADGRYSLVVCHDGYLILATYDETDGWSAPLQLAPGWDGLPGADSAPRYPHIVPLGARWLVSYLDTQAGSPTWSQPTVCETDGRNTFNATALHLEASAHTRTALSYVAATRTCYAANAADVLGAQAYAADDAAQNLTGLQVLGYQRRTDPESGRLRVEVWDPAGALKSCAREGAPAAALRPLATAVLRRGYMLGSVAATVALDPHYVTAIGYHWGQGRGICEIEALDGWGLLALWHPDTVLTYSGHSVIELLNHLLARVGLQADDDGSLGAAYVVPTFTVTPATSGLEAVRSLLRLGGLAATWQEDGDLQVLQPDTWAPGALAVGPQEILTASYGARAPQANVVRVYGQDAGLARVGGAASDDVGAQRLGLSLVATHYDGRVTSAAQAELAALGEAEHAGRDARHELVSVPMRPDVECWDTVSLSSDETLVPASDRLRRVTGIEEELDCDRGVYRSALLLTRR